MTANRHWAFVGVLLLVLADGAIALAYRYRGERSEGPGLLRASTVLAALATVLVLTLAAKWRPRLPWIALTALTLVATATALVFAWTSNPCRYQGCIRFLHDSPFYYWWATAAALATVGGWSFYFAIKQSHGRWGLRIVGLVFSMLLAAVGAMAATAPTYDGFICGPVLPYDAPPPPPDPNKPC